MKALGYFLLIPFSMFLYIVLATEMGISQRYPIPHFLLMAVGLFFLFRLIREKFSIWRLLCNVGGWAMALLFAWWTLSYSNFEELEAPLAAGDQTNALSIELKNENGEATSLGKLIGEKEGVILSFYRGHW